MNNYRVYGESRQVGAIGIMESFMENVVTWSSLEAYNQVRNNHYSRNREHVLIKEIRLVTDTNSTVIEPRAYL